VTGGRIREVELLLLVRVGEKNEQRGELECTPRWAEVPVPGFWMYWTQKLSSMKSEYHAIMNKYPEAASI
jgi:hypothetical protein